MRPMLKYDVAFESSRLIAKKEVRSGRLAHTLKPQAKKMPLRAGAEYPTRTMDI